jgi:heptaprenylglyceryl phosphate synthase
MISKIKDILEISVIVGGGIRTPSIAAEKVNAGADFIVTGSIIESDSSLMRAFSDAIHWGIEENDS